MARLAYLGTPALAVGPLEALVAAGHDVVLVVSKPDAKRGRGGALVMSPVKEAATKLGLPTSDSLTDLRGLGLDLAVVVAFGRIIPTDLLEEIPMVNIHFSLLPRWRGAAPVERAILAGDERTGVAIMAVEPELDSGGVYASASVEVGDKSLAELQTELSALGTDLLLPIVDTWTTQRAPLVAQEGTPSYAKKVTGAELELDFSGSATAALRTIRLGRAFTFAGPKRLRVLAATLADPLRAVPGTVVGTTVATGDGGLELVTVQPEGKGPIEAAAWRRGIHGDSPPFLGREQGTHDPASRVEA